MEPMRFDENMAANWENFEKEFKVYRMAALKKKDPDEVCASLLNLAGREAIDIQEQFVYKEEIKVENNVTQEKEDKNDPDTLIRKFREHCVAKKNIILERHKFNTCFQGPKESYASFIKTLRKLASTCDYGTVKEELMRDRLVCANKSGDVIDLLVKEADLTWIRAIEICLMHERSEEVKRLLSDKHQGTSTDKEDVHFIKKKQYGHKKPEGTPSQSKCWCCGGSHPRGKEQCKAYGKQCHKCKKMGHFAEHCFSGQQQSGGQQKPSGYRYFRQKRVDELGYQEQQQQEEIEEIYVDIVPIDEIKGKGEIYVTLKLDGMAVKLKVDTGAKCNVMPLDTLRRVSPNKHINEEEKVELEAYGGHTFFSEGTTTFDCYRNNNTHKILFHIVDKPGQRILLGLHDILKLDLLKMSNDVHAINIPEQPEIIEFPNLFTGKLGKLPVEYRMKVDDKVQPVIRPPRRVPVAMKEEVKTEIDRMLAMGVITKVTEATKWVSSMVAARKKNKEIRICIDPKDLNTALQRPRHPMRTIEEVTANMPDARVFTILDAKNGFWQIPLSRESRKLTCFNTPFGRFMFNRMPYGINSGSEVFQRTMETLFSGYPCEVIVDDILVWGRNMEEHDQRLKRVLQRAAEINLSLNRSKCKFRVKQVTYVGHVLADDGIHPDPDKIRAIADMPTPPDKQALQRFLGMINYVSKFVKNYSNMTAPLRELLHKEAEWYWQEQQEEAFTKLKKAITSPPVLQFYDVKKPVTLTCDASKSGLGAACLQEGLPVAYASRALTSTEQNYAQIEKELLAVVFACKRFDDYVYGRPITVETDHKPLVTILNKPLHAAPTRLQKMMLVLHRYNIDITYKQGKELHIADALSRAYLPETDGGETGQYEVMSILPISETRREQLSKATASDSTCGQLVRMIRDGWTNEYKHAPKQVQPYYAYRDELTVQDGLIVKGERVVIPESLRQEYLVELHRGHSGAEAVKRRARGQYSGQASTLTWKIMSPDAQHATNTSHTNRRSR
jgi:hypothetical protein